jgi:hypothetical protein
MGHACSLWCRRLALCRGLAFAKKRRASQVRCSLEFAVSMMSSGTEMFTMVKEQLLGDRHGPGSVQAWVEPVLAAAHYAVLSSPRRQQHHLLARVVSAAVGCSKFRTTIVLSYSREYEFDPKAWPFYRQDGSFCLGGAWYNAGQWLLSSYYHVGCGRSCR